MRTALSIIFGLILIAIAIVMSCSKITILNEVVLEAETRADTTERRSPPPIEDTLHEITFNPVIIGWEVISGEDTIRVEL